MQEAIMNITSNATSDKGVETLEDTVTVILRVKGVFVEKLDLREAIGIDTNYRWYGLIKVCRKIKGFSDLYDDYRTHNCVPRSLARIIARKAHDGEKVVFAYKNKDS